MSNNNNGWWAQAQAAEATYWQDAAPADNHTAAHAQDFSSATAAADAAAANVAAAQADAAWAEGYAAGAAAAYANQQSYAADAQQQQQQAYQQQAYQPYYPTSPQQPYGGQAAYAPTRDHVVAGLLAIFLGSLGVHKFYLGYTSTGFIMLAVTILGSLFTLGLAAGVMSIVAFIEGIIYLSKPQSTFDSIYVYQKKEWF